MQARIENPAMMVPGALEAFQQLGAAATNAGIPETTLQMVELRASQINGCSGCVDIHSRALEHMGESSERIHLIAAWGDAPYFSDAERVRWRSQRRPPASPTVQTRYPTRSGMRPRATTPRISSPRSWSRSQRSTLTTART